MDKRWMDTVRSSVDSGASDRGTVNEDLQGSVKVLGEGEYKRVIRAGSG